MIKLGFIGAGKVGSALAVRLRSKGYPVVAVCDAKRDAAEIFAKAVNGSKIVETNQDVADAADVIFITTPDGYINTVAAQVKWKAGQSAVHCSGGNTTAILTPAREMGAKVGVFHPGQMFADREKAIDNIQGATFDVEAEEPLLSTLKEIASALDGHWIEVKAGDRPVFHVAEEFTSLYMMLLARLSAKLMQALGISEKQSIQVNLPMMRATTSNFEAFGTSRALTGPVDRGDVETIKRHIDGLRKTYSSVLPLYRELALQNIPFALEHGSINQQQAEQIEAVLKTY
jgi:predicted short-subunit dehydrogenase-like oxidoreductase (DUF2520 family)